MALPRNWPRFVPSGGIVAALALGAACALLAAVLGAPLAAVSLLAGVFVTFLLGLVALDVGLSARAWAQSGVELERKLPKAFALGAPQVLTLHLKNPGSLTWHVRIFDEVDAFFGFDGLPQTISLDPATAQDARYRATPLKRGMASFGVVQLRWRSRWRTCEVLVAMGQSQSVPVYPNFAEVARYAWLAGDRRLSQMGIKTYAQRGAGTDFRQLSEYRAGESIRHIDWRATLRHGKAVVREFQDERDQCVLFLLDCGRRMRADETGVASGSGSHFDHALNAVMLLAYVAQREGDEVGALTFGNPHGQTRHVAPRKGAAALNALMNGLYDLEPTAAHSDYLAAAQALLQVHRKRALVIVITNFRDDEAADMRPALKLLRQRHLVMVASLSERVLRELTQQPIHSAAGAALNATAHAFAQARADAFKRVLGGDALSVDVEPAGLAAALVNRYHAVKSRGLL
jgi:uncharacterized protein (DUF58 family)